VAPTQAFVAMHWGSEVLGGRHGGGVNALTSPAFCPQSKQPELKQAAVKISPAALPWQLQARAWLPAAQALQRRAVLLALCAELDFAMCLPFGREDDAGDAAQADAAAAAATRTAAGAEAELGIWLHAAAASAPAPAERTALLAAIESLLGLEAPETLRYADVQRGQHRSVRLQGSSSRPLQAYLLAGDTRAAGWVGTLLQDRLPAAPFGRALLAGTAAPPLALPARGAQVCSCFNVFEPDIDQCLAGCSGSPEQRLAQLQGRLRCGTNCGSCLPALRQRVLKVPASLEARPATAETP
jgi:assimilatory nitrate reductase catalytic subunit